MALHTDQQMAHDSLVRSLSPFDFPAGLGKDCTAVLPVVARDVVEVTRDGSLDKNAGFLILILIVENKMRGETSELHGPMAVRLMLTRWMVLGTGC